MATSKLLKPTNVTISIPAFTDQPDQRVNSNCIDKEADAINSLSEQIEPLTKNKYGTSINIAPYNDSNRYITLSDGYFHFVLTSGQTGMGFVFPSNGGSININIGGAEGRYCVFVKKGMQLSANGTFAAATFYPFV